MNHGSLQNVIAANTKPKAPVVGMGATRIGWTDRHACTVIEVRSAKRIVVQRDTATRVLKPGSQVMSDQQTYTFALDPSGSTYVVTLRKNGAWVSEGESMKNGTRFMIGYRSEYYDFSF